MGNNLQLILILIVFSFSFLSWLINKLRERYAIKQAQIMRERAREESLRTGRGPEGADPALEQRRAAEMRRREAAKGGRPVMMGPNGPFPPTQRGPMRPVGPGGGQVLTPGRRLGAPVPPVVAAPQRPAQRRPIGPPVRQQGPVRPTPLPPKQQQRPRPGAGRPQDRAGARGEITTSRPMVDLVEESTTRRIVSEPAAAGGAGMGKMSAKPGASSALGTVSRSELRRAFILSEVLSPPLALRESGEGATNT